MFTGIIQSTGEITSIDKSGDWVVTIAAGKLPLERAAIGASISCNGICLTLVEKTGNQFKAQLSAETLSKTTAIHWRIGTRLNLEPALKMGEELGGHLISGHIDGVARVISKDKERNSLRFVFEVPHEFAKFLAPKGSITLDGVSLTVNEVQNTRFGVNIIPYTRGETTLGGLEPGGEVNFEVDLMARYAERLLNVKAAS